jgi:hypothetical protein
MVMEPILVFGMPSFAGTPWINARRNTQQHRIFKGVQSGELNFNETKKLQARVQNLENHAEANGVVTPLGARAHLAEEA